MGFDIYGKAPTAEVGTYFRNSVWWWHETWQYCCEVAPDIIPPRVQELGHSNDGAGLDAERARRLAERLSMHLASGHTEQWAQEREAALAALPDEPCTICGGSGTRHDGAKIRALNIGSEVPDDFPCNGCEGKGTRRPFETAYSFSVENVSEFRDFLQHCGGFKIW